MSTPAIRLGGLHYMDDWLLITESTFLCQQSLSSMPIFILALHWRLQRGYLWWCMLATSWRCRRFFDCLCMFAVTQRPYLQFNDRRREQNSLQGICMNIEEAAPTGERWHCLQDRLPKCSWWDVRTSTQHRIFSIFTYRMDPPLWYSEQRMDTSVWSTLSWR